MVILRRLPYMPTVVIFDCESDGRPETISECPDFTNVQCTVVCAIEWTTGTSFEEATKIVCWRDVVPSRGVGPFTPLFDAFDRADLIVGYNCLDFDFPLLFKYYGRRHLQRYQGHRLKTLDVFTRIRAVTGSWPKLDYLLKCNGLESKTSSGAEAVKMWESGEREKLQSYCEADVFLTAKLAMLPHIMMNGMRIPEHVYGIRPTLESVMYRSRPTKSVATASDDEKEYVLVALKV